MKGSRKSWPLRLLHLEAVGQKETLEYSFSEFLLVHSGNHCGRTGTQGFQHSLKDWEKVAV